MFILTNYNFARASRYFVHFFAAATTLETSYLHEPAVWSRWTKHKSCRFLVLNLDNDIHSLKENFAKLNEIE